MFSCPAFGNFVVPFEGMNEMVDAIEVLVLDTKIINTKTEDGLSCYVFPHYQRSGDGTITCWFEKFD